MISGTTHIGATLRDMFDLSPAKLSSDPYEAIRKELGR
jgi:hypothetical protein